MQPKTLTSSLHPNTIANRYLNCRVEMEHVKLIDSTTPVLLPAGLIHYRSRRQIERELWARVQSPTDLQTAHGAVWVPASPGHAARRIERSLRDVVTKGEAAHALAVESHILEGRIGMDKLLAHDLLEHQVERVTGAAVRRIAVRAAAAHHRPGVIGLVADDERPRVAGAAAQHRNVHAVGFALYASLRNVLGVSCF